MLGVDAWQRGTALLQHFPWNERCRLPETITASPCMLLRRAVEIFMRSVGARGSSTATPVSRREARGRSEQLLLRNLSPGQRRQYETRGSFDVTGGASGKRYRVLQGHQLNVEELDAAGRRVRLWCFMPEGGVPVEDIMLAQKLALELFENDALRIANKSPLWDYTSDRGLWSTRRYRGGMR